MKNWAFATIAKESLFNARKARKQLLFEALRCRPMVERVLYVEPHKRIWQRQATRSGKALGFRVRQCNLVLPGERFSTVRAINRWFVYRQLCHELKSRWRWCFFFYHPYDAGLMTYMNRHGSVIFDWTEDWSAYYGDERLLRHQNAALKNASAVITVSDTLGDMARKICGPQKQILILPNATGLKVQGSLPCPEELRQIPGPRIGYIGQIGPWFDADLLIRLASAKPRWQFVLIGHREGNCCSIFRDLSNLHFLGQRPFDEIQALMMQCQVLIAPYYQDISGDSSKLYDYLTSGLPIVSADIETARRLNPHVRVASDTGSWVEAIQDALKENDPQRAKARQKESLQHCWDVRAEKLLAWLSDL